MIEGEQNQEQQLSVMEFGSAFPEAVHALRRRSGLSQAELAHLLVSDSHKSVTSLRLWISGLETGKIPSPSPLTIERLEKLSVIFSQKLGVEIDLTVQHQEQMNLQYTRELPQVFRATRTNPFTEREIGELDQTNELLVYLPANLTMTELCAIYGIRTNINFNYERMINNMMVSEDQYFIASASKTPEMLNQPAIFAKRVYEDEELHGMDFRRYLAFAGTFADKFGYFPDETYWTFLLAGSYDRSGVSIVGFDRNGILSHHGWMRDFKSKFCGSRYVVLAPRIEITPETEVLPRSYRKI